MGPRHSDPLPQKKIPLATGGCSELEATKSRNIQCQQFAEVSVVKLAFGPTSQAASVGVNIKTSMETRHFVGGQGERSYGLGLWTLGEPILYEPLVAGTYDRVLASVLNT